MLKQFSGRLKSCTMRARHFLAGLCYDLGLALDVQIAGGSDPAVINGEDTLIFSMDGICADLETGMEPQSMSGSVKPNLKEFKDRKGNVITVAVYDENGEMTIPVIYYGGTLPVNGSFVTLALVPAPFAGDWVVLGHSMKGGNEDAISCDTHLRRWKYVTAA